MPRVNHFEIMVADPEKAADFYRSVFGWNIHKYDGPIDYWLVSTGDGPGIDGAICRPMTEAPAHTVNTVTVDDIRGTIEKIKAAGGDCRMEIHPIPEVGEFVYVTDCAGTQFGLLQPVRRGN